MEEGRTGTKQYVMGMTYSLPELEQVIRYLQDHAEVIGKSSRIKCLIY